jgi:plastocyanin domain-containing protein
MIAERRNAATTFPEVKRLEELMRKALFALVLLAAAPTLAAEAASSGKDGRKVEIKVTDEGFVPREVKVKKGKPTTLVFTRVTDSTCITAIDIPDENVKEFELPLNKPVSLTVTPKKRGIEKFHCSAMAMGDGKLIVED